MAESGTDLYEADFALWSERQGRLLREAAARRPNEPIDWENLAEEIESLGRSQAAALSNRLARIIEHLLKLQFSPATAPRRLWEETVRVQRLRVAKLLRESPSLQPRLFDLVGDAAELGTAYAVESLLRHGEDEAIEAIRAHGGCYSVIEVVEFQPPS